MAVQHVQTVYDYIPDGTNYDEQELKIADGHPDKWFNALGFWYVNSSNLNIGSIVCPFESSICKALGVLDSNTGKALILEGHTCKIADKEKTKIAASDPKPYERILNLINPPPPV